MKSQVEYPASYIAPPVETTEDYIEYRKRRVALQKYGDLREPTLFEFLKWWVSQRQWTASTWWYWNVYPHGVFSNVKQSLRKLVWKLYRKLG